MSGIKTLDTDLNERTQSSQVLVQGVYEALGVGDVSTVVAAMSPSIEWREAEGNPLKMDGAPWRGPEAVVENLFGRLGAEWESFTVSPISFHAAGPVVTVQGRYTGKYSATGRDLDAQFCHVWNTEDGKVTSFQQYADTAQFQRVMGCD